jgi:hypothetical protein
VKALALEGRITLDAELANATGGPWHPATSVRGLVFPVTPPVATETPAEFEARLGSAQENVPQQSDYPLPSQPSAGRAVVPPGNAPSNPWPIVVVLGTIGFLIMSVFWAMGTKATMQNVQNQVLEDAKRQYFISRDNGGSHIDLHVHAGLAAEAALQAHNEEAYAAWIKVRDAHARLAGM